MKLTLRPEKAPPAVVEWRLLVLPFSVTRPANKHWGTWLESMDIHTWIAVPEAELARTAFFFIDDISLQAIDEPPLSITTPLDEYYVGESIPWSIQAGTTGGQVQVELQRDGLSIKQHSCAIQAGRGSGVFDSAALQPAI